MQEMDCPQQCGGNFCSLRCYTWPIENNLLTGSASVQQALEWAETEAMLKQGFDVLPPFDRARGPDMDFFTEEGKSQWRVLAEEDPEHHAPDCKTMSRARGKPF